MIAYSYLARRSVQYTPLLIMAGSTLALTLTLSGCATPRVDPTMSINSAEQAIAAADRTRIADAASPELSEAREKLAAAQAAVKAEEPSQAERLAVESRLDAELASAKTEATKAQAVNDEIKKSTATLSQEMQRNSGAK